MSHHMTLHEDVLERILNILKQDDYYRTLEDLPVIDELTAYDDIRLFPGLYDTSTIIERVTAEADLIERQLRQPGMYPQHTNLSHPTSNPPKPTPNFQPTSTDNSTESSPQSSLPCGQRTLQHRLVLQMHHPHKHHPRRLYTHHINQKSLHTHSTPQQAPTDSILKCL